MADDFDDVEDMLEAPFRKAAEVSGVELTIGKLELVIEAIASYS